MRVKSLVLMGASILTISALATLPANAKTFKFAFQGDAQSLDPHSLNETFTIGMLANVYEPLIDYDKDMNKIPGLATKWEATSPTTWKFELRKGVKFQNGNPFTADDVIFTWKRMGSEGSDQKARAGLIKNITKVDDYNIIVETPVPNPTVLNEMTQMLIMDKEWAEKHNATKSSSTFVIVVVSRCTIDLPSSKDTSRLSLKSFCIFSASLSRLSLLSITEYSQSINEPYLSVVLLAENSKCTWVLISPGYIIELSSVSMSVASGYLSIISIYGAIDMISFSNTTAWSFRYLPSTYR